MLQEVYIENFALIERLRFSFERGLNVLTGETGAGKSIIIDAIEMALGGRTSAEVVRAGEERALVELLLDLSGQGGIKEILGASGHRVEEDGSLLLGREIYRGGRTVARINGRVATASLLRDIGAALVDIHGQHEHQSLLNPERQIQLLDRYGGQELEDLVLTMARVYQGLKGIEREMAVYLGDEKDRVRRVDLLTYQLKELEAAHLRPGEEEEILAQRRVLANAEKLWALTSLSYQILYAGEEGSSILDLLGRVTVSLQEASRLDEGLKPFLEDLANISYQLDDLARELRSYRERITFDPQTLAQLDQRLDLINNLKRKYGDSSDEILAYQKEAAAELDRLERGEETLRQLNEKREELVAQALVLGQQIRAKRQAAARLLENQVSQELAYLRMPGTVFQVNLSPLPKEELSPRGLDRVEFLFSPNRGEPPRALSRIASGGEMSRVMLALKSLLAELDDIPALIFDEIDSGVGGDAARAVAEKLAGLGRSRQVLVVTHLAQIAAFADNHYRLEKGTVGERTVTRAEVLGQEEQVREIARMLAGEESQASMNHARDILMRSREAKAQMSGARTDGKPFPNKTPGPFGPL
ncbi:MAG: DNA repair protein RecN [Firmicutes bacterium]|nr:DNA repair protein RecN [Bacillota bacterium]MCL5039081.1 DNA repair protein RecN [Bacillota bacterium]